MKNFISIVSLLIVLAFTHVSQAEIVYIHNDALGSPIMETNEQGTVISRSHYKPFGGTLEAMKEGIGYTGHLNDADLGLTYMQARYYDPVIGRFYSNDPIGFTGGVDTFNRYSYVGNNPYKYTDPNGEEKITIGYQAELVVFAGVKVSFSLSYDTDNGEIAATAQGGPRLGFGAAYGPTLSVSQSEEGPAQTESKPLEVALTGELAAGALGGSVDLLSEQTLAGGGKTSAGTGVDKMDANTQKILPKPGVSGTVGLEVTKEFTSDLFGKEK
jgi:RHS repeat-associated protein